MGLVLDFRNAIIQEAAYSSNKLGGSGETDPRAGGTGKPRPLLVHLAPFSHMLLQEVSEEADLGKVSLGMIWLFQLGCISLTFP